MGDKPIRDFSAKSTQDLCEQFMPQDGFMARCLSSDIDSDDKESFCTWLYEERFGAAEKEVTKDDVARPVESSFEAIQQAVTNAVFEILDGQEVGDGTRFNVIPIHTFPDVVVVRSINNQKLYEVPYTRDANRVYLGQVREVENVYVQKQLFEAGINPASKGLVECELTGPIVMKDRTKRIAYGAVLVPNELDSDGEAVTPEQIERAAHEWMQSYRNVDLQHTLNNVATPVESYILPMNLEVEYGGRKYVLPKGTWVLATKILDEGTWDRVDSGALTGYSVMGIRRTTLDSTTKSLEGAAIKKTLLRDLGPDWVAVAVSIVDEPAVPKAKFFAIKSKEEEPKPKEEPAQKSWYQRVVDFFATSLIGDSGDVASSIKTDTSINTIEEVEEMKPEELRALIDEAVKSAVEPLQQTVTALQAKVEKPVVEEKVEEPAAPVVEESNTELEAFKSQVMDKLAKLETAMGRSNAASKSLKGQDGAEKSEEQVTITGRDAFGRKREGK